MSFRPLELLVFLCQFLEWSWHISKLRYELGTVYSHTKKTMYTTGSGWRSLLFRLPKLSVGQEQFLFQKTQSQRRSTIVYWIHISSGWVWGWLQRISCIQHPELHHVQLVFAEDNNVVTDVESARDISEVLLDGLLEDLTSRICAKIESPVPLQSFVCYKCGDVSTLRG